MNTVTQGYKEGSAVRGPTVRQKHFVKKNYTFHRGWSQNGQHFLAMTTVTTYLKSLGHFGNLLTTQTLCPKLLLGTPAPPSSSSARLSIPL